MKGAILLLLGLSVPAFSQIADPQKREAAETFEGEGSVLGGEKAKREAPTFEGQGSVLGGEKAKREAPTFQGEGSVLGGEKAKREAPTFQGEGSVLGGEKVKREAATFQGEGTVLGGEKAKRSLDGEAGEGNGFYEEVPRDKRETVKASGNVLEGTETKRDAPAPSAPPPSNDAPTNPFSKAIAKIKEMVHNLVAKFKGTKSADQPEPKKDA